MKAVDEDAPLAACYLVHATSDANRQALHPPRESRCARRLYHQMQMVSLDTEVNHTETPAQAFAPTMLLRGLRSLRNKRALDRPIDRWCSKVGEVVFNLDVKRMDRAAERRRKRLEAKEKTP